MLSDKLQIKEVTEHLQIKSENIVRQVIRPEKMGLKGGSFIIKTPQINYNLLSLAYIEWDITLKNIRLDNLQIDNADKPFITQCKISLKGGTPMSNAMEDINVCINDGEAINMKSQHIQQILNLLLVGKNDSDKIFPAKFIDLNQIYNLDGDLSAPYANALYTDRRLFENEQDFFSKVFRTGSAAFHNQLTTQFKFREVICFPPFNPYYLVKENLKKDGIFFNMSNLIPSVRKMKIDIHFCEKLTESIFHMFVGGYDSQNDGGSGANRVNRIQITNINANLHCKWYKENQLIPKKLNYIIPIWKYKPYKFRVILDNDLASVNGCIRFMNIPKYIIIAGQRQKKAVSYKCAAYASYDVNTGGIATSRISALFDNSVDAHLRINSLTVNVNGQDKLSQLNQERLYELTLNNSNDDFMYSIEQFYGKQSYFDAANVVERINHCRDFVALSIEDLGIENFHISRENTINFNIDLEAFVGLHSRDFNINYTYDLYFHFIYDNIGVDIHPKFSRIILMKN